MAKVQGSSPAKQRGNAAVYTAVLSKHSTLPGSEKKESGPSGSLLMQGLVAMQQLGINLLGRDSQGYPAPRTTSQVFCNLPILGVAAL